MPALTYAPPLPHHAQPAMAVAGHSGAADSDFSFSGLLHEALDIVNPLQHLPVIGTIYRAITHEHVGDFAKVAGDTLYGGLWGGVSSLADVAFEKLTGKSAEDTVLAWFDSPDSKAAAKPQAVAQAAPAAAANPASAANPATQDVTALSAALSARGIDGDMATRALYAYQKSMGISATLPN